MKTSQNVVVWNEFRHERHNATVKKLYPDGMHAPIIKALQAAGHNVSAATLDEPEHGLTQAKLDQTDVLLWWGHGAHDEVKDEVVERVYKRVLGGMGLIALHSAHYSKIFRKLMGTSCNLLWREASDKERFWCVQPAHPIAEGLPLMWELPNEEMYGESFDIPQPEQLIYISWFTGGEVFRSGATWTRGAGKVFYFRPGHETYPTYFDENVLKVISNGVRFVAPTAFAAPIVANAKPLETLPEYTQTEGIH